jgi:hypothetical protein
MATVVVRHKAGGMNVWIKGHQGPSDVFAPAMKSDKAFQDMNDPKTKG